MKNSKNILISGASSGLGAEIARQYAHKGHRLILFARSDEKLKKVVNDCRDNGAEVISVILDINDHNAVTQFINKVDEAHPIDIAIANAGVMFTTKDASALEEYDNYNALAQTNFLACIHFTSIIAERMKARQSGQIALIASLSALQPITRAPTYSATKAGIVAYGEAMRTKLYLQGVTVSVISPGFIETDMTRKMKSWQPFKLSVEKAAQNVIKAIQKRKAHAAFPLGLVIMAGSGRLLPWAIRRHIVKNFD